VPKPGNFLNFFALGILGLVSPQSTLQQPWACLVVIFAFAVSQLPLTEASCLLDDTYEAAELSCGYLSAEQYVHVVIGFRGGQVVLGLAF
jgi:hypothetical protein